MTALSRSVIGWLGGLLAPPPPVLRPVPVRIGPRPNSAGGRLRRRAARWFSDN